MADLLNKFISGINSGVNTVSENSKLFIEKTRLNSSIKEITEKKSKIAQQIGMATYQMYKNGDTIYKQFEEMYKKIDDCDKEIEELNVQLSNLQTSSDLQLNENTGVKCKCGHYNKNGAAFCASCGAKLD